MSVLLSSLSSWLSRCPYRDDLDVCVTALPATEYSTLLDSAFLNHRGMAGGLPAVLLFVSVLPLLAFCRSKFPADSFLCDLLILIWPGSLAVGIPPSFPFVWGTAGTGVAFLLAGGVGWKGKLSEVGPGRLQFLAVYRALMMMATCVVILAVDFNAYPRALAKTTTYGYSVMDLGVGSIVFATAVCSPHARRIPLPGSSVTRIFAALKSVWVLLVIGTVRFALLWQVGYHVPPDEYGTHWNFFFTIAVVALYSAILLPSPGTATFVFWGQGLAIGVAYQAWLLGEGVEHYMFFAQRLDFVTANREGIFGCLGYCALHTLGIATGRTISTEAKVKDTLKSLATLFTLSAMALFVLRQRPFYVLPSRRAVNLPYVISMIAVNTFVMISLVLLDLARGNREVYISACLNGIQSSMLVYFLVANVLTGVTNVVGQPLVQANWIAVTVILAYSFALGSLAHIAGKKGWRLKKW
jgi:phosphatidylinositol glycan class W